MVAFGIRATTARPDTATCSPQLSAQGGNGWYGTSAPVTTGRSTAAGSSVSWLTVNSEAFVATSLTFRQLYGTETLRDSYAAGARLGIWLPRTFFPTSMPVFPDRIGPARPCSPCWRRSAAHHPNSFNRNGVVCRWRRGEQPGHFRHHIAGPVHEDRIPRRLLTAAELPNASSRPLARRPRLTFKALVQTVSTSLVYRFNWAGPVVAKY